MNGLAICAGVAGIELGLKLAVPGYRTVCYVEQEAYCAAVLAARMADKGLDEAPIWDDLRTFDGRPWRGIVDSVSSGFPCQPFSVAGKQQGTADERWLWPDTARIIGECQPEWLFLENVPGLVGLGLRDVLADLAALGFDAEWDIFSAAASGAPHLRKRFFLLAYSNRARLEEHKVCHSGLPERPGGGEGQSEMAHGQGQYGEGAERGERILARPGLRRQEVADPAQQQDGRGGQPRENAGRVSWWEVEPDVDRVVNGSASRVDRLRTIGNSVVPAVAARAWRVLSDRLAADGTQGQLDGLA